MHKLPNDFPNETSEMPGIKGEFMVAIQKKLKNCTGKLKKKLSAIKNFSWKVLFDFAN